MPFNMKPIRIQINMALSGFEIAIGGMTSIPVVGGLVFLGFKSFGENSLEVSKLKPKSKPVAKKDSSSSENKLTASKSKAKKISMNASESINDRATPVEKPTETKKEAPTPIKQQPELETKISTSD